MTSIEWLDTCASTNSELAARGDAPAGTVVATRSQTAGRGQRGNTWESAPGANLTFSLLLRPQMLPAARQFEMSMIVSIAVADVIDAVLADAGVVRRAAIKWPNDIYIDDSKVCGILIENTLSGSSIERSIVGVGLNVNQRQFVGDAPNPISLCHYTGVDHALQPLLQRVCDRIVDVFDEYERNPLPRVLTEAYMSRMWRREGEWPYATPDGSVFRASIVSVGSDGILTLSGNRRFAFKEVQFVL